MPGLPHIGVLGPAPNEALETNPVDVDDSDLLQTETLSDSGENELDWNFVPNKMKYQITVKPTEKRDSKTIVDFYIRLDEGCDEDVGTEPIKLGRAERFTLSEDELKKVFRHYTISINITQDNSFECDLFVDGLERSIPEEDIALSNTFAEIRIHDTSNPFLIYEKGKPVLVKEKYKIKIIKKIKGSDESKTIFVEVTNNSRKTKPSRLPQIRQDESVDTALERIKNESRRGSDQEASYWDDWEPRMFVEKGSANNASGNRYGYLMEFQITEKVSSFAYPITPKDTAKITNAVFDDSDLCCSDGRHEGNLVFRDHASFREQVNKMKLSGTPKEICQGLGICDEIGEMLQDDLKYSNLYRFQRDSISKILDAACSDEKNTVMISARTAGGKTESFAIPILNECIRNDKPGIKAMICYPTKALANDQASRFIALIYHLNKRVSKKITIGILHGDIPKNIDDSAGKTYSGLPFECPKCKQGLLRPQSPEKVVCDNFECKEELDFVWAHSRTQTYARPPDILITNPDTLIWRLMLEPEHHSIFGREVLACQDCGMTYAVTGRKNSCNANGGCNGKNIQKILPAPPSFLVFDEIHLFKGSFGINTSYLLTRIESIIKHYAKVFHYKENHRITRIGSTATISNPIEFVKKFFNVDEGKYWTIPEDQGKIENYYEMGKSDDSFSRHHVYLMPYAYTSDSTIGLTIQYLEALAKNGKPPTRLAEKLVGQGRYLQILTFVNSIKASNSLISQTRRTVSAELPDMQIDGHTTDFDKSQRSDVEKKFNMQDLHVVFATSTLEVGVDFRNVHCVLINGFPYSFNDYLQRIGRGGRRGDSLIVTVCQNWKPVDHYYYSHGRSALSDQHKNIEPIPITRNNSEAIKRHVYGACLDYIVMNKDAKYDTANVTTLENISKDREEINASVLSSCGIPKNLENNALLHLDEFVYQIERLAQTTKIERKPKALYSRFLADINPQHNLTSLRSTDPDVTVEVFWNQ